MATCLHTRTRRHKGLDGSASNPPQTEILQHGWTALMGYNHVDTRSVGIQRKQQKARFAWDQTRSMALAGGATLSRGSAAQDELLVGSRGVAVVSGSSVRYVRGSRELKRRSGMHGSERAASAGRHSR